MIGYYHQLFLFRLTQFLVNSYDKFIRQISQQNYILKTKSATPMAEQAEQTKVSYNSRTQRQATEGTNRFRIQKTSSTVARNTGYAKQLQKERSLKKFRESLYYDERMNTVPKSTIQNHIIESIVEDADILMQKKELIQSIYKLKQLNLLKNKDLQLKKIPGVGKLAFVLNDFHTKSTNNGYSRNFGGVFYTR